MFISIRRTSDRRSELASVARWTAALCLLLTLWSAAAVVTHAHASSADALKCTVCMTAHSARPAPVSQRAVPTPVVALSIVPRPGRVASRLLAFALHTRPPPAA